MNNTSISIITPTTGKNGLKKLIQSINSQGVTFEHIILWDDKREDEFLYPDAQTIKTKDPYSLNEIGNNKRYSIVVPGNMISGSASGSALRSIGLMAASSPYITFSDDDVWMDDGHLKSLLAAINGKSWAYCKRRIWESEDTCIGVDDFESVGDSPNRKVPYEMVDNNSMIFSRRLGTSAAVIYRETQEYNDDRLMYAFLKQYGGEPGRTNIATINQICPSRLRAMFNQFCTKHNIGS